MNLIAQYLAPGLHPLHQGSHAQLAGDGQSSENGPSNCINEQEVTTMFMSPYDSAVYIEIGDIRSVLAKIE